MVARETPVNCLDDILCESDSHRVGIVAERREGKVERCLDVEVAQLSTISVKQTT